VETPVSVKAHQRQLPATPSVRTIFATRLGVSLENVVATIESPASHQGTERPDAQRLLRELEKLALEGDGEDGSGDAHGRTIGIDEIERRAAHSTQWRAYALADALVGADAAEATRSYMRLRAQGERLSGLIYLMAQRLRDALAVAERLRAGESVASVKRGLRMPARAAERFVADVARSDVTRLRAALGAIADLELDSRGGAVLAADRTPSAALDEDTIALRAISEIAS